MSVYKEVGYVVRQIEKESVQIYDDACDFGVPVKSLSDSILILIRDMFLPYCDNKVKTERYATGATQTIEFDGGFPAVIEAGFEKATVKYITIQNHSKDYIGYVTVVTETTEKAKSEATKYDY